MGLTHALKKFLEKSAVRSFRFQQREKYVFVSEKTEHLAGEAVSDRFAHRMLGV